MRAFQLDLGIFFFDQQWLLNEEFINLVTKNWKEVEDRCPERCYSLDCWHRCLVWMRTKLKGWNIRRLGDQKRETRELSLEEWTHRYDMERQLENLYLQEEVYWRQRMGKHWLVSGDSNTRFFHQFANGRRRKGTIIQMETDQGMITEQDAIMKHVVHFYKELFGPVDSRNNFLSNNFWESNRKVNAEDRENLIKLFTEKEINSQFLT